jgi:cytochrome d ubiquinol oxidase subunit II
METLWFVLIAGMLAAYVVLDGFDLGAGAVHLWVARSEDERRRVIRSIGPVWDGNEVWLIAAGGTLFAAFPALYATAFSGFYLPLMMVLWMLIGRACAIEFRGLVEGPPWRPFWDAIFSVSSGLLALFFGVALGNVVRGVPIQPDGHFFAPLWTSFQPKGEAGILDWYTLVVGLAALASLAMHGGLWIALKSDGELRARARRTSMAAWAVAAALVVLAGILTAVVQPHALHRFRAAPWGAGFPLAAGAALAGVVAFFRRERDAAAFLCSCGYLAAMLATAAFSVWPFVLPSSLEPGAGLTASGAAAGAKTLKLQLAWWLPGIGLATAYFVFLYRKFAGKVSLDDEGY